MLFEDSIVPMDDCSNQIYYMNGFGLSEHTRLLCDVIDHMTNDLSAITGLNKDKILEDYFYIHDYDPIREVLKKKGKWNPEDDKSLAMISFEHGNIRVSCD